MWPKPFHGKESLIETRSCDCRRDFAVKPNAQIRLINVRSLINPVSLFWVVIRVKNKGNSVQKSGRPVAAFVIRQNCLRPADRRLHPAYQLDSVDQPTDVCLPVVWFREIETIVEFHWAATTNRKGISDLAIASPSHWISDSRTAARKPRI